MYPLRLHKATPQFSIQYLARRLARKTFRQSVFFVMHTISSIEKALDELNNRAAEQDGQGDRTNPSEFAINFVGRVNQLSRDSIITGHV